MIGHLSADEVIRQAKSGRTKPVLMLCRAETDTPVEVFCKVSAGCDEGVTSLAREVVASCLAADLNLPVPKPYLVKISADLVAAVADVDIKKRLQSSSPVGFGSAKVGSQFSAWTRGNRVTDAMLPSALGTLLFDAVIENADRRTTNPNCLVAGDRLRLIDHELGFPLNSRLLNWRPPWQIGGMQWLCQPNGHIFYWDLKLKQKKRLLNFEVLVGQWSAISDARLRKYRDAIPPEWATALPAIDGALKQVGRARDNFNGVIAEINRILK